MDAYGGVGTGIVLLMWLTLLSLLYYATPDLHLRAVGSAAACRRPPASADSDQPIWPIGSIWWWPRPRRFATRRRRAA